MANADDLELLRQPDPGHRWPTIDIDGSRLTSITLAAVAGALAWQGSWQSAIFVVAFMTAAIYEAVAIGTDRVPTITDLLRSAWPIRLAAILIGVALWVDHLGPGWVV